MTTVRDLALETVLEHCILTRDGRPVAVLFYCQTIRFHVPFGTGLTSSHARCTQKGSGLWTSINYWSFALLTNCANDCTAWCSQHHGHGTRTHTHPTLQAGSALASPTLLCVVSTVILQSTVEICRNVPCGMKLSRLALEDPVRGRGRALAAELTGAAGRTQPAAWCKRFQISCPRPHV